MRASERVSPNSPCAARSAFVRETMSPAISGVGEADGAAGYGRGPGRGTAQADASVAMPSRRACRRISVLLLRARQRSIRRNPRRLEQSVPAEWARHASPGTRGTMTEGQDTRDAADAMGDARMRFHRALLQSHRLRGLFDALHDPPSTFCLLLKRLGYSPEQTLLDAN